MLRLDDTLKKIFGWKQIPSDTSYKRFFKKFNQRINTEVFPAIQQWFFVQLQLDNYALDLDSTAIARYGTQEGNHIGYNPAKRGRPSHHPLFAFLGNERMVAMRPNTTEAALRMVNLAYNMISLFRQVSSEKPK